MARALIIGVAIGAFAFPAASAAQVSSSDLLVRIDQLENQMRRLTGEIEQMEYRNQQLEAEIRRLEEDGEGRARDPRGPARLPAPASRQGPAPPPGPVATGPATLPYTAPPPPPSAGRRSDAFDPLEHPDAPGAPRQLGSAYVTPPSVSAGRPGGYREGGVSTAAADEAPYPGAGGARGPNPGYAAVPTAPPSQTPRDTFDLGYGYVMRKDYALAQETLREFMRRYPSDRLAGDAQYYLGESLFQTQDYRGAADAFLVVSKNYEASTKAPDAMLRLGQSLAALNEKELACSTFGEVVRKYPRASAGVKQSVEREQKRVRC